MNEIPEHLLKRATAAATQPPTVDTHSVSTIEVRYEVHVGGDLQCDTRDAEHALNVYTRLLAANPGPGIVQCHRVESVRVPVVLGLVYGFVEA